MRLLSEISDVPLTAGPADGHIKGPTSSYPGCVQVDTSYLWEMKLLALQNERS